MKRRNFIKSLCAAIPVIVVAPVIIASKRELIASKRELTAGERYYKKNWTDLQKYPLRPDECFPCIDEESRKAYAKFMKESEEFVMYGGKKIDLITGTLGRSPLTDHKIIFIDK